MSCKVIIYKKTCLLPIVYPRKANSSKGEITAVTCQESLVVVLIFFAARTPDLISVSENKLLSYYAPLKRFALYR